MSDISAQTTDDDQIPEPVDALPVEDEDWENLLAVHFGGGAPATEADEATDETPPEGQEGQLQAPSAEEPPGPASSDDGAGGTTPSGIEVGGATYTPEELAQAAAMRNWMAQYPQYTEQFIQYLSGQAQIVPTGQAQPQPQPEPTKPTLEVPANEDWDFVPPSLKERVATYDTELEQLRATVAQQQQFLAQQAQRAELEQAAQAQAAIDAGVAKFREQYPVDDTTFQTIRNQAAQLNIVDNLAAQYGDPQRAVYETLELAMLRDPALRQLQVAQVQEQALEDIRRQQKQAALNSSGGTAPRTSPPPSTPDESREAMVREIRAALYGNG